MIPIDGATPLFHYYVADAVAAAIIEMPALTRRRRPRLPR
jgi:hypothetical protein